jgi:hypothetical protein
MKISKQEKENANGNNCQGLLGWLNPFVDG